MVDNHIRGNFLVFNLSQLKANPNILLVSMCCEEEKQQNIEM